MVQAHHISSPFLKEDGGDSHHMVLKRCQGSSENIQMLPRLIDTVSLAKAMLLKWNGEKCLFHPIKYLAFLSYR